MGLMVPVYKEGIFTILAMLVILASQSSRCHRGQPMRMKPSKRHSTSQYSIDKSPLSKIIGLSTHELASLRDTMPRHVVEELKVELMFKWKRHDQFVGRPQWPIVVFFHA